MLKANFNRLLGVFVLLCCTFTGTALADPTQKVVVRTCLINTDLFPLWRKTGDEHLAFPGINIELTHEIAKRVGVDIEWVRAPFQRCLRLLRQGEVDMITVASYKSERERFGRYPKVFDKIDVSRRFKFDTYSAFVRKDSDVTWDGQSFYNLGSQLVAIEIGASVESYLKELGVMTLPLPSIEHAFSMLMKGRIAAVVTNENNGRHFDLTSIKKLEPTVTRKPYYLMISDEFYDKNEQLSESIWIQSGELQEDVYPAILDKYARLKKWPNGSDKK